MSWRDYMVNNNTIKRDSVFIGQVVKLNTVKIKDNKFIPDIYSVYRSILFTIDDDGLSKIINTVILILRL